ncbi:MAG TPA: SDR family oxidoreductase [Streptosporangiaceae bacterium]|jgi:3-oxoacyl-[acyl-carrier protein] reductase
MTDAPVILITGAASGIGAATARCFARGGWRLVLADLDASGLGAVGAELPGLGAAGVLSVPTDVTSVDSVTALVGAAAQAGPLDAVHANVGICPPERPLVDTDPATVDRVLDVNIKGTVNTLRASVPRVRDGGAIVITASDSGLLAHPGAAVYAASKIALIGLGRALAAELAPRRVRVNMVCPGGVDTPLTRGVYGDTIEAELASYAVTNPLGGIAQPEWIADAVFFLASATHVTGVSLRVDGGDGLMGAV